jgi:hypothetical protein
VCGEISDERRDEGSWPGGIRKRDWSTEVVQKGRVEDATAALEGGLVGGLGFAEADEGLGQVRVDFPGNEGVEGETALAVESGSGFEAGLEGAVGAEEEDEVRGSSGTGRVIQGRGKRNSSSPRSEARSWAMA